MEASQAEWCVTVLDQPHSKQRGFVLVLKRDFHLSLCCCLLSCLWATLRKVLCGLYFLHEIFIHIDKILLSIFLLQAEQSLVSQPLFLCASCFRHGFVFVSLCCALSSMSTSLLSWGIKSWAQLSKGLDVRATYSSTVMDCPGTNCKFRN